MVKTGSNVTVKIRIVTVTIRMTRTSPHPLQTVTPPLTSCNPTVEYFSTARQESSSGDSALQAGKKQFSDENSKEAHASLVLAAKEKEEKQEPYNTLGSTPYPFGDDDAWDRATTEGDEEPADPRSNGWNEDEDQAAVEKHNTWRSADTILDDIRELDRADAVIESEEEVFEMARSVFGHAQEASR